MASQSIIKATILSDLSKWDTGKVDKDLRNIGDQADKATGKFGSFSGGLGKVAGAVGGLFAAGAVADYFVEAGKAASQDAAEVDKLANTLANSTNATSAQIDATNSWIDSMQLATGVADTELRTAVGNLAVTTGDVGKAQELAGLAADVAAQKGISLSAATKIVTKAYTGNTAALLKQNPLWDKNKDGILSSEEALAGLGKSSEGAAEKAVTPWQQITIIFDELKESLGNVVLPLFEKVKEWLKEPGNIDKLKENFEKVATAAKDFGEKVVEALDFLIRNKDTIQTIATIIGALAVAYGVASAAMAIYTAVTAAWSAAALIATGIGAAFGAVMAFITAPITLVVLAIVALIAIIVLLYKNWDTISAWLKKTWESIKTKAVEIWNSLKEWFVNTWNSIKEKASSVFEALKNTVSEKIRAVITFVKELPGKALEALGNLTSTLKQKGIDLVTGLWNGIKDKWKEAREWLGDVNDKAKEALGNLASTLLEKGKDLVRGFINGIKSMGGAIRDALLSLVPGPIKNFVGGLFGLRTLGIEEVPSMTRFGGSRFIYSSVNPSVITGSSTTTLESPVVNYNITVNSMVANRETGREVVKAIKEYERVGGPTWRR